MTVNVAGPYSPDLSAPRSPGLTFFSPGTDSFIFRRDQVVKILCAPQGRALSAEWTLAHNRVRTPVDRGSLLPGFDNCFELTIPCQSLVPGFYDVKFEVTLSKAQTLHGTTTIGWRIDDVAYHAGKPAGFEAFWRDALARLDAVPSLPKWILEKNLRGSEIDAYNVRFAALPESYDPAGVGAAEVEVFRVRFNSYGRIIEGWFTKPAGSGPYPALLILPGAGNNPRPAPVEHARHGYAALDIQVHGSPVDAIHYDKLPADAVTRPEDSADYKTYLAAVQGARALRLLPGVDADSLAVLGGSQGGCLAIAVAALDHGMKAAISAITHRAYLPWLAWTEKMNEQKESGAAGFAPPANAVWGKDSFFDAVNFASSIQCPVLMNAGLIDHISPATGVFAVYAAIKGEKRIIPLPNISHDWLPAFERNAWHWLNTILRNEEGS